MPIRKLAPLLAAVLALAAAVACEDGYTPDDSEQNPGGFGGKYERGGSGGGGGEAGDGGTGGGAGGAGGSGGEGGGGGVETGITVREVRPARGSIAGGESVIVSGLGFVTSIPASLDPDDVVRVRFGGNPAIGIRVIDDDTILVPTPPGAPGNVDVVVSNHLGDAVCAGCYRYLEPVDLDGLEPREGPLAGGTTLTLRGQGLRDGMVVLLGDRAALDVRLAGDGSLTALTPPADVEGPVTVRVFDADGDDYLRLAFTYRDRLGLSAVEPPGGPVGGGNRVTIRGTGLEGARVFFGGVEATAQAGAGGTLEATVPPGAGPGPVAVELRTAAESIVREGAYAYFDPAEEGVNLYVVSPARGPLAAGGPVTLVGTGFDAGSLAVRFGGVLADADAAGPHVITATAPPGAAPGPVDVAVRVATGGDTLEGGYRYFVPVVVGDVTPGAGPTAGGTAITVVGSGFPPGARLFVGALEALDVVRVNDTTLTAVTPPGTDGPVAVRVVDPADPEGAGILPGGFVYRGTFDARTLSPTVGARAGGTRVTLLGTGFEPGLAVRFGGVPARTVEVKNPFLATAVSPGGTNGTVDVEVEQGGVTVRLPGSFTYFDPTNTSGGSSGGPIDGTLNVTALDSGLARRGLPVPDCRVVLGNGELEGYTDERGQVTFSHPSLVKAQVVSVSREGYQTVTVVNQESENLTVFMEPNMEPPPCANGVDDDGDGLLDWDGGGNPDLADLDGCFCGPQNLPEDKQQYAHLCRCPMVPGESAGCCNGTDDDGDGLIDGEDPDCECTGGSSEGPLAACSNCIDDDGDGTVDYISMSSPSDPGCNGYGDDDERGALVAGRVFGFKKPPTRILGPTEREVAYVRTSYQSVYYAPPWSTPQRGYEIRTDGGGYAFEFRSDVFLAMYAVYGIVDDATGAFEPLLMGVRRGVSATTSRAVTDAHITLDMHLDMAVPVAIDNFPTVGGLPGMVEVYAYLDLGKEGVVPVGQVSTTTPTARLTKLPVLSGEDYVFQLWGDMGNGGYPFTVTLRRQAGDISERPDGTGGITMGPVMGLTRFLAPVGPFAGVIEWTSETGPEADITTLQIDEPTLSGLVPLWQIVVPGRERRVVVPEEVVDELERLYPAGAYLQLTLITGREPRFSYDQWSYDHLGLDAFTSFTYDATIIELVPGGGTP
jgi:hypothetical protein